MKRLMFWVYDKVFGRRLGELFRDKYQPGGVYYD